MYPETCQARQCPFLGVTQYDGELALVRQQLELRASGHITGGSAASRVRFIDIWFSLRGMPQHLRFAVGLD